MSRSDKEGAERAMAKSKKPAAKKQEKSEKSSQARSAPVIDTAAAAAAAAALVAGGITTPSPEAATAPRKESSMFKQIKQGMANKPALGGILDKGGSASKKSGSPFGHGYKQVGHNQTFGADVNRTGVPRRTGG
jgi:hypothetical protein